MCSKEQLHSDLFLGVAFHHNIKWANPSPSPAHDLELRLKGKLEAVHLGLQAQHRTQLPFMLSVLLKAANKCW